MSQTPPAASPAAQAGALFDRIDWHTVPGATALCGRAESGAGAAALFATDPAHARGALGARDGEALIWSIRLARAQHLPMVWLLDCAGAKVDEGLPALAAFRRFYREALEARAAAVPLLAVLGRGCWGGASLLAMLADVRVFTPRTRFATSGPAIIEAVEGKDVFDASDAAQVDALLGAQARARIDPGARVAESSAHRGILEEWLARPGGPRSAYADVTGAGGAAPAVHDQRTRLQSLLPPGYSAAQRGNIVHALPAAGSGKAVFCGYLAGAAVGVAECRTLTQLLDEIAAAHPRSPLVLVLDAAGHAATRADEGALLAHHLSALSRRILALRAAGHRVTLWIPGRASGAVYVVFAAPVDSVSVLPGARVEVLAAQAVDRILGRAVAGAGSAQELVTLGIADAILDERLNGYHAA